MVGARDFAVLQNCQTGPGDHLSLLLFNRNSVSFMGGKGFLKGLGCDVDHSPPSSMEVNNESNYVSASLVVLHGTNRDNFNFLPFMLTF
jgi:hypothetical protein